MRIDLFDFELPESSIALRPSIPRDAARLLYVDPNNSKTLFQNKSVSDLPDLLQPNDVLVFNNTKVIPSRLFGVRKRIGDAGDETSARIELMLHLREDNQTWRAFARPAKRLKVGDVISFLEPDGHVAFTARVSQKQQTGEVVVVFSLAGAALDQAIMLLGKLPLPPYIAGKRATDLQDISDYQTLYAQQEGAVAAPTAGLHFTENLFQRLSEKGIAHNFVTLHVGAGTFLPVKVDDTDNHVMHAESGTITQETANALNQVKQRGGRIVAVGTTSLRLLESATDENGIIHPFSGQTKIFITPGYSFRLVDVLMTNFHLPRSTLFMLVCAFSGQDVMHQAYRYAVEEGYRFYSYGDSSLLFRRNT